MKGSADLLEEPTIVSTKDDYEVGIKCFHVNEEFDEYVQDGKAEYICEVNCSRTLYRIVKRSETHRLSFKIPRKEVKGKVEFTVLLVAKEKINNYSSVRFHEDFSNFVFNLNKGDVLAFYRKFDFDADIEYRKLRAASSFIAVDEDPDAELIRIDLNSDKIIIWMPTEEYDMFSKSSISKNKKYATIFHSSIVLNALIYALYNKKEYEGKLWERTLDYRLDLENLSLDNIPKVAQKLLGNPFQRLLSELTYINTLSLELDE